MQVISSPKQLQTICQRIKRRGEVIAVVPTMGALHEGHLTLLRAAKKKADKLIMTLFVNPTQFGPREDLKCYPKDLKGDLTKARRTGVDIVFAPRISSIYPQGYETFVEVTKATQKLCGRGRPTHFRGVITIVLKLFNLITPDYAYFGLKDFQQFAVLCRMVKDLDLPVKMVGVPTVREKDGLAMSSRNAYLNAKQRIAATCLSRGLFKVKKEVKQGKRNIGRLLKLIKIEIRKESLIRIDYVDCMDAETIQPIKKYHRGKTLFAIAVFIGKTRLIDNIVV